jgi:CBS domain containing-hemolysin-like protein
VEGQVSLEDLSDIMNYSFESEEAESIGGLVLSLAGEFPDEGFKTVYGIWTIEVMELEDHRIKQLRLVKTMPRKLEEEKGTSS